MLFTCRPTMALLTVVLTVIAIAGCASSAPPPAPGSPALSFPEPRRVVVVAVGDSRFIAARTSADADAGRAFAEISRWIPSTYKTFFISVAQAVYQGVTWLIETDRAASTVPRDVTPGAVVTSTFARTLGRSGRFDHVVAMEREPVGEARRDADVIVRIAVPSWGLVRVRDGEPPLLAGFADVRARMVTRETGVVLWEHAEDVTHPDRLPLDSSTKDRALTRDNLIEVLERAGRRLATEFVYAQGRGQ